MNILTNEMKNYLALNSMAEKDSVILFGDSWDKEIPCSQIAESCGFNFKVYNRSFSRLSILDAAKYYECCINALSPEGVILHIGSEDIDLFKNNPSEFDRAYLMLISAVRSVNKKIRIAIVSLENSSNNEIVTELNRHLKAIAESENCDFCSVERTKVWNPEAIRQVCSFFYDQGFLAPLKIKKPLRDVVEIMYGYVKFMESSAEEFERMPQVS